MQTLVIGHKNPDMDAICSAIGYAEFKRATGVPDVRAARCGNTNERIDFALNKFGFEAPVFLTSVQPRVEDVMERDVVCAGRDEPVYEALALIGEKSFRGLPVIDGDRRCIGLISGFKISRYLFPPRENVTHAREVHASLQDIISTIGGTLLAIGSQVHFNLGQDLLLPVFAAAIVGGLGSPIGAILGVLLLALVETLVTNLNFGMLTGDAFLYVPIAYGPAAGFCLLVITLIFRPRGLFHSESKRV